MAPFAKIFKIEIDGWIHGVSRYHGEFKDEMLFGIVKVLGPSVRRAIDEGIPLDLVDIVIRFNKACRNMVGEVEILLAFLTNFPPPQTLKGEKRKTLLMTLSKVEQSYPGALSLLEQNWRQQLESAGQEMIEYDMATDYTAIVEEPGASMYESPQSESAQRSLTGVGVGLSRPQEGDAQVAQGEADSAKSAGSAQDSGKTGSGKIIGKMN